MLPEVVLGAATMSATLGGWAAVRGHRARRVADKLAQRLDASRVIVGAQGRLEAEGQIDGVDVVVEHLEACSPAPRGFHTRIAARLPSHLGALKIGAPRSAMIDVLSLHPVTPSGDLGFDRRIAVRGPESVVGPALDEASRALLAGLVLGRRGRVHRGWVEITVPGLEWRLDRIEDQLGVVARVAASLQFEKAEAATRLQRIAELDGLSAVRQLALLRLLELHPDSACTRRAVADALASDVIRLRLIAASVLPEAGAREARRLLASAETDPEDRVRALGLLVRHEGDAEAREEIHRLLQSGSPLVQVAAAAALAELGGPEAAAVLYEVAHRLFTPSNVRRAALTALDRLRNRMGLDREGALSLCPPVGAGALALTESSEL